MQEFETSTRQSLPKFRPKIVKNPGIFSNDGAIVGFLAILG